MEEEGRLRGERLQLRCTREEKAALKLKADECGMPVGPYMVSVALGRKTKSKINDHMVNELRRLGGLQKHLFTEGGGAMSKQYAGILVELQAAIAKVSAL